MKRELFELGKVKIEDGGKVTISYKKVNKDGGVEYTDQVDVSSPRVCHPDLTAALSKLKRIVAHTNELMPYRKLPKMVGAALKAVKHMDAVFDQLDERVLESITVTGISLQGTTEKGSVVITGKRTLHHTGGALNSPKINFEGDSFKIETETRTIVEEIVDEVYQYLFENKAAQVVMEFDDEEVAA